MSFADKSLFVYFSQLNDKNKLPFIVDFFCDLLEFVYPKTKFTIEVSIENGSKIKAGIL